MSVCVFAVLLFFFFQAEDGIRDLVRSRGLGDVYKRQSLPFVNISFLLASPQNPSATASNKKPGRLARVVAVSYTHLTLPTSDLV